MKINNVLGDVTDVSAKKEALAMSYTVGCFIQRHRCKHLALVTSRTSSICILAFCIVLECSDEPPVPLFTLQRIVETVANFRRCSDTSELGFHALRCTLKGILKRE